MKPGALVFLFFIISCFTVLSQQQAPKPVKLNAISSNLYEVIDGRGAKGGIYIGDNGVMVIDTKQDENSVKQTLEELAKITDKPIKFIVNTHSDGDHVTGNRFFPSNITIVSHENCRKEFLLPKRDGSPSDWAGTDLFKFVPSVTFENDMTLYLGTKRVELSYFGIGHTTGDAVVYFPEEKVAFIGDQVFVGRVQLIHAYKGGNSFEHVKTLKKMLEKVNAEKFYTGHSVVLSRDDINKHIGLMTELQQKVKSLIADNNTIDQITSEFEAGQKALVEIIYSEIKKQ